MDARELDLQLAEALDELNLTKRALQEQVLENQRLRASALRMQGLVQEALIMSGDILNVIDPRTNNG